MTDLPQNRFKAALSQFQMQRGVWCTMSDPLATEMIAGCGFDWMLFDTEHSPMDPVTVLPLLQAVASYPVTPIVRPGSLNAAEIKKLLDIGVQTILVPFVQNAQEAAEAVAAVTYPPEGIRGVAGLTRATRFATIPGYHKKARQEVCLLVQVETVEAMDNIESIAAVDGVDGIFIGPADLGGQYGYPGEPNHPEVTKAVLSSIKRIRAAGQPAGILTLSDEIYAQAIEAGAVFAARDLDLAALRKGLSKA